MFLTCGINQTDELFIRHQIEKKMMKWKLLNLYYNK